MGMSASQARLLSLTARLSDLELQAQQISNSKIGLSRDTQKVSKEYIDALNKENLFIVAGFNNNGSPQSQELNYFNLTGVDSPLLTQYGLCNNANQILVTQQESAAFKQARNVEEFCELMGAPTKITYSNGLGQVEYDTAYSDLAAARKKLNDYGTTHVNGYQEDGQWQYGVNLNTISNITYTDSEIFSQLSANNDSIEDASYYYFGGVEKVKFSADGSSSNNTVLCFYEGENNNDSNSALTSVVNQIIGFASPAIKTMLQGKLGDNYSNASAQIDSAITTAQANTQNYFANELANKQKYDLNNGEDGYNLKTIGFTKGTTQVWEDNDPTIERYIDMSQVVKTFLAYFDAACASLNGNSDSAYLSEISNDKITRPAVNELSFKYKSAQDTQTYSSSDSADWLENIDYEMPNSGETEDNVRTQYEAFLEAYRNAKTYFETFKDKTITKSENTDYYTNIYNKMTEGYFSMNNEQDTLSNAAWVQTQITTGNLILYKCTKDENNNNDMKWKGTSWNTCLDIKESEDKSYIAKAEAKYEADMDKIQSKDKRFDLELKNIDTEHQAITTEVDSVKNVIKKNVERSFKFFENA